MSEPQPALRILIYHTSGLVSEFLQYELTDALEFISLLQPRKLFTSKLLTMAGAFSVSNVASQHVSRIDLLTQEAIALDFPEWITEQTIVTTQQEFLSITGLDRGEPQERYLSMAPGEIFTSHVAYHLIGAETVYARVMGTMMMPVELRSKINQLFDQPVLQFKRPEGGATFIHPVNMVRMTAFPGPPAHGPDVWRAEIVTL